MKQFLRTGLQIDNVKMISDVLDNGGSPLYREELKRAMTREMQDEFARIGALPAAQFAALIKFDVVTMVEQRSDPLQGL